jgi:hypothetical protein
MQDLKAAAEVDAFSARQFEGLKLFMLKKNGGFGQLVKLKASLVAAEATKAFAIIRSQAHSCTEAVVRNVFTSIVLSAQQAADLQWKVLLDGPVPRAAVHQNLKYMYAFNKCQQTFQATAHSYVCKQQAVAQQECSVHIHRCLRATAAVSDYWGHVLQSSRCMDAAHAFIESYQNLVQLHAACTRVFRNELAAVVAIDASNAFQRHNSEQAALPLAICAQDADTIATAGEASGLAFTSGSIHAVGEEDTSSRTKSGHVAPRLAQQLASTSKSPNSGQLASAQQATARRLTTRSISSQRPRAASGGIQHSPSPARTSTRHKDAPHRHLTSAAANYSRSAQLLTSQPMPAPHDAYMQEVQELDAAAEELFRRLHAIPQRQHIRARSHFVPRTFTAFPQDITSSNEACTSLDDEQRLAKPSQGRSSR